MVQSTPFGNQGAQSRIAAAISPGVVPNQLLASSPAVRLKAHKIAHSLLTQQWLRLPDGKGARWFSLTFIDSRCNALEYAPNVDMAALKRRVDQLIRRVGLSAVCIDEVQALSNMPLKGIGRSLMVHVHAIGWTTDTRATPKAIEQRLCASTALRHVLGAKTANVRRIPSQDTLERTCAYLFKAPVIAKFMAPKSTGGWELRDTKLGGFHHMRLMECLSYLELPKMVWGVSEGAPVARSLRHKLKRWHEKQTKEPIGYLRTAWPRYWAHSPCKITRAAFDFAWVEPGDGWTAWELAAMKWQRAKARSQSSRSGGGQP